MSPYRPCWWSSRRPPVVRAPGPDVVEDDVGAVHHQAGRGLTGPGTTDPEEHVLDQGGVSRLATAAEARAVRTADLQEHRRVDRPGVEDDSGELGPRHVADLHGDIPALWAEGGKSETEDHGVRAGDLDALLEVVDARVRIRFLPNASAMLIAVTDVFGLAMKKSLIGSDFPARSVGPGRYRPSCGAPSAP